MRAGLLGGLGDGGWAWEVAGAGAVATSFWQRWHGGFAWTQAALNWHAGIAKAACGALRICSGSCRPGRIAPDGAHSYSGPEGRGARIWPIDLLTCTARRLHPLKLGVLTRLLSIGST